MGDKKNWISQHDRYRLETLLWGGDEVIWVVPAWHGWKTLTLFYQQSKHWEFVGHKLTHAAGIIFCHHNAPIHRIITLAKDLAELAKEKSRKENQFAYLVLESFDHVGRNLRTFLKERYGDLEEVVLSGSGDNMVRVEEAYTRIKRDEFLPRRKLHQIVQSLQKDRIKAETVEADIMKDSSDELKTLRSYFGTNLADWCHIAELWDYIGT